MKTRKQVKKRNQRIIMITILLIILILIVLNIQQVIEGLKDGAKSAVHSF